jgi:hypothetical protein
MERMFQERTLRSASGGWRSRERGSAMTRKRAERLTGYEIRDVPATRGLVGVGAFDGPTLVCKSDGPERVSGE